MHYYYCINTRVDIKLCYTLLRCFYLVLRFVGSVLNKPRININTSVHEVNFPKKNSLATI
jgi:hypothetical protein